eukprot:2615351-Pleurochrysis_carterae.AAC.2
MHGFWCAPRVASIAALARALPFGGNPRRVMASASTCTDENNNPFDARGAGTMLTNVRRLLRRVW